MTQQRLTPAEFFKATRPDGQTRRMEFDSDVPKTLRESTSEPQVYVSFRNAGIWKRCEKCGRDCLGEDGLREHEATH